ncbi:hypothetical protein [uncultured Mediterranean phage uvMED]|jgi:DNA replication initiation complex subunit (GINS family)|nr:hypothetical protein [uncultured Mediterranean phage uvMED]|tara:strand:+ start:111 stop:335 length:225 start_codon:yes stop_codon:yes gene_type:complete
MSLGKVKKDFYYSVEARITEFFSNAEDAAKKETPGSNCDVEIQSIKFNKANIKLNDKANDVRSKGDQKPTGEAE